MNSLEGKGMKDKQKEPTLEELKFQLAEERTKVQRLEVCAKSTAEERSKFKKRLLEVIESDD